MSDIFDEFLEKFSLESERLFRDEGTWAEHYFFGELWIGGK
jgi:hypothetical protein